MRIQPRRRNAGRGEERGGRGEERQARHSIESLDALSVDIARMIDHDAAAELWDRYNRGERNVFTRRLYTLQGQQAFDAWRASLASPLAFVFHLLALWLFVVHTLSWFKVMPKTMGFVRIGGKRVSDGAIIAAGRIAAVVCTVVAYALFRWGTS